MYRARLTRQTIVDCLLGFNESVVEHVKPQAGVCLRNTAMRDRQNHQSRSSEVLRGNELTCVTTSSETRQENSEARSTYLKHDERNDLNEKREDVVLNGALANADKRLAGTK